MQRVLAVPYESVRNLFAFRTFYSDSETISNTLEAIKNDGRYVPRDLAESDDSFRQVVACSVVFGEQGVLCLRRSAKSNRTALRLRYTLMLGGHVDENDAQSDSPLEHCVKRELREELGVSIHQLRLLGIAADPETTSGWLHLGFVFEGRLESNLIRTSKANDLQEFTQVTKNSTIDFTSLDTLYSRLDQLDPWSEMFVRANPQSVLWRSPNVSPTHLQHRLPFAS
jgi:predicted NUDIX family phosphoesterase